jgi:hypothetical protein
MQRTFLVLFISFVFLSGVGNADTIEFSGYFNDSLNTALVASDLSAAQFGDDYAIANNVALYSLSVPTAGQVTFTSKGFAAGGADPYFTLFQGTGNSATFLDSNYIQAFSTGGDFIISDPLAAGSYMIAMGVSANMSIAENWGVGSLGDGFTFLGEPDYLGNYFYDLQVSTPAVTVPEPSLMLHVCIVGTVLVGLAGFRMKVRKRSPL